MIRESLGRSRSPVRLPVVMLFALSAACANESEPERPLIRIGYTPYLTHGSMFIAAAEGFFDDQGIDVELVRMRSAAMGIPSLTQGDLDVVSGPMSPSLFNGVQRGAPLKLVLDKGTYREGCNAVALVAHSPLEERAGIAPPIRVGIGPEPFTTFRMERIAEHLGWRLEDLELHSLHAASRYEALASGRLDVAMLSEPYLGRYTNDGGEIWLTMWELFPDHQYSTFAFGPRLLDQDRDLGRRVATALLQGVRAQNRGKTDRNIEILQEALGWERELLEEACWAPMRDDGRINTESIEEFQEWALARGDLDEIVPPFVYLDSTFAEHARRVLDGSP